MKECKWSPFTDLEAPLHGRKPRRAWIEPCPFDAGASNDQFDKIVSIITRSPQHEFVCVAHNADGMRRYISSERTRDRVYHAVHFKPATKEVIERGMVWPLPNFILGIDVRNQAEADRDVPILLQTPAAKRIVRTNLEGQIVFPFPSGAYLPSFPPEAALWSDKKRNDWADGQARATYMTRCECCPDLVIVSGGDKPMHPVNVRSVRDQCAAAGVPFRFEGWGDYKPYADQTGADDPTWMKSFKLLNAKGYLYVTPEGNTDHVCRYGSARMVKMRGCSRILDRVTHDGWLEAPK